MANFMPESTKTADSGAIRRLTGSKDLGLLPFCLLSTLFNAASLYGGCSKLKSEVIPKTLPPLIPLEPDCRDPLSDRIEFVR